MTNIKQLMKKIKNLEEQVRYWKKKDKELEVKVKSLEDYKREVIDTIYHLGEKGNAVFIGTQKDVKELKSKLQIPQGDKT